MLFTRKRQTRTNLARNKSRKLAAMLALAALASVGYLMLNHARPSAAKASGRTPVESMQCRQ